MVSRTLEHEPGWSPGKIMRQDKELDGAADAIAITAARR
jgi:hypothetical protein